MELSKQIEHGDVIVKHGNKLVRASKRSKKIFGVFNEKSTIKGFTVTSEAKVGEPFEFHIPRGVRYYGEAETKSK